jgi:hypothetical protein
MKLKIEQIRKIIKEEVTDYQNQFSTSPHPALIDFDINELEMIADMLIDIDNIIANIQDITVNRHAQNPTFARAIGKVVGSTSVLRGIIDDSIVSLEDELP